MSKFGKKVRLRLATGLVLAATAAVLFITNIENIPTKKKVSAYPHPDELTPLYIAMASCIEGFEYSPKTQHTVKARKLKHEERFQACDEYVELSGTEEIDFAISMRALQLEDYGSTKAHQAKAYQDITYLIDSGTDLAWPFARRARMKANEYNNPKAALSDINKAIELAIERPRPLYFERRARIYLMLAHQEEDQNLVYGALIDLERTLELEPERESALKLKALAIDFLKYLHHSQGQSVQKG